MGEIIELKRAAGNTPRMRRVEREVSVATARDPLSLTWTWWRLGIVVWGSMWLSPFGLRIEPRDDR